LHAVNARSNHVHAVVSASKPIAAVLVDLKAWSTRGLRDAAIVPSEGRVWTRHGSTRVINSELSLAAAIDYVTRMQDRSK